MKKSTSIPISIFRTPNSNRLPGYLLKTVCCLLLIMGTFSLQAITRTFEGTENTDWNNPLNWFPVGLPGSNDDVIIDIAEPCCEPGCFCNVKQPVVIMDIPATIRSLTVEDGELFIRESLTINNVFNNFGGLNAIRVLDFLEVSFGGSITINYAGKNGIENQGEIIIGRNSSIVIDQSDDHGLINTGVVDLRGVLQINSAGGNGVVNSGLIEIFDGLNGAAGIHIGLNGSIGGHGIVNSGQLKNFNSIHIGQNGNIGMNGIVNQGQGIFENETTVFGGRLFRGQITIGTDGKVGRNGIHNLSGGSFKNSHLIEIDNTGTDGILNEGSGTTFVNDGGRISLDLIGFQSTPGDAIENKGRASFKNINSATIAIGQNGGGIGGTGIRNFSIGTTFLNDNASVILIDDTGTISGNGHGLTNASGAAFNNENGSSVAIGQSSIGNTGITNSGSGTIFTNRATITVDHTGTNSEFGSGLSNSSGAKFDNLSGANLLIGQNGGNIDGAGIENSGQNTSFRNINATVVIDHTNVNSALGFGIVNAGAASFQNENGANLYVGRNGGDIGQAGILNRDNGTNFFNTFGAQITIDNTGTNHVEGDGLLNQDQAQFFNLNNSKLYIGRNGGNIGRIGILNSGATFSQTLATITIDHTGSGGGEGRGLVNQNNAVFDNNTQGLILIGQNGGNIRTSGVYNHAGSSFKNVGRLEIDNTGNMALWNQGQFSNFGSNSEIRVGLYGSIGADGIRNEGNFSNSSSSIVRVQATAGTGVFNAGNSSTIFDNQGSLHIDQTGNDGLFNDDLFTNSGSILIGNNSGRIGIDGLQNEGNFVNETNGLIKIQSTNRIGLTNGITSFQFTNHGQIEIDDTSSDGLFNDKFFANFGSVRIGLNGPIGRDGLTNRDQLQNEANSTIVVRSTVANGVRNYPVGAVAVLINDGQIEINQTGASGLYNQWSLLNKGRFLVGKNGGNIVQSGIRNEHIISNDPPGEIHVSHTGLAGLFNEGSNARVFNEGFMKIEQAGTYGLQNEGTFINDECSNLILAAAVNNSNTFTNNTYTSVDTDKPHINSGSFNNRGLLHYVQDNPIPSVNNSEITVAPTTAGHCSVIQPAFALGTGLLPNILGIYTNAAGTQSAGSYDIATNTFIADPPLAERTHHLFVRVEDPARGCTWSTIWKLTVENCCDAPQALCQSIEVALDESGNASISVGDVDGGSTADCGLQRISIDQTNFDCSQAGTTQLVELTITDIIGLSDQCHATITVTDDTPPTAQCQDIIIQLDANGVASITTADIDNNSTDACGIQSLSLDQTDFDCQMAGDHTVYLSVTDYNDNVATCSATVTVEDHVAPVAKCLDMVVELDENGQTSLSPQEIDNGSSDACGIADLRLDLTELNCQDLGDNTLILTVTDVNGNTSQCTANVQVLDITPPEVWAGLLFLSGNASSASFEVEAVADDVCDPDVSLLSLMELPALGSMDISYKVKNKKKIIIDLENNKLKIQAPDPEAFWAAVESQGGVAVQNGQDLKLSLSDQSTHYQYNFHNNGELKEVIAPSFVLLVRAADASGNSAEATASPAFPQSSLSAVSDRSPNSNYSTIPSTTNELADPFKVKINNTLEDHSLKVYPNPFSTQATIRFHLAERQQVRLEIFNLQGQRLRILESGWQDAGWQEQVWDGNADNGEVLGAGMYIVQLQIGNEKLTKKVTIAR